MFSEERWRDSKSSKKASGGSGVTVSVRQTGLHLHPADVLLLGAMGCDIVQGYGIARPMPAADLPAWVSGYRLPALVSA